MSDHIEGLLEVTVAHRKILADRIISLELVRESGLPPFEAGSHVDVEVAPGVLRQYSIANDPSESHRYVLAVLRAENSRGGSSHIHDLIVAGSRLRISKPRNNFPLREDAELTILIAGGIGITPILSMAHRLANLKRRFVLHYCVRTFLLAAFRQEIAEAKFADQVFIHADDGLPSQALDLEIVLAEAALPGSHLYICGPAGLIEHVVRKSELSGIDQSHVHVERFGADVDKNGSDFIVSAARSGIDVVVKSEQTIAEALIAQNVPVFLSCEEGVCGTCLTKVLAGIPDHRDHYLSEREKSAGKEVMICCSRSLSDRLVLDI